jgi:hypothetical protein
LAQRNHLYVQQFTKGIDLFIGQRLNLLGEMWELISFTILDGGLPVAQGSKNGSKVAACNFGYDTPSSELI